MLILRTNFPPIIALVDTQARSLLKHADIGRPLAETILAVQPTAHKISPTSHRSAQTTNTERKLADLERDVIDGMLTPIEAHRAFGHKPMGTGGRSRKAGQEDFASWLRTRIAKLSDREALIEEVRRVQTDRAPGRAARVRALNRRINEADPDYVAKLRAALADLYDALTTAPEDACRRQAERAAALRQKLRAVAA